MDNRMPKLTIVPILRAGDSQQLAERVVTYGVRGLPDGCNGEIDMDAANCWVFRLKKDGMEILDFRAHATAEDALAALQQYVDALPSN